VRAKKDELWDSKYSILSGYYYSYFCTVGGCHDDVSPTETDVPQDESSWTFLPFDNVSPGRCVLWTVRPLYDVSLTGGSRPLTAYRRVIKSYLYIAHQTRYMERVNNVDTNATRIHMFYISVRKNIHVLWIIRHGTANYTYIVIYK
jgi:hypothetical protein